MRRAIIAAALLVGLGAGVAARPTSTVGGPAAARLPGARGPACATCGAATTTTTTPTTTTTLAGAAPDWTSAMLAVWNLDEDSGARVDATGHGHTMNAFVGVPGNDVVTKMQGSAALLLNGTNGVRRGPDDALAAPALPASVGCWFRPTDTSNGFEPQELIGSHDFSVGGFFLTWNDGSAVYNWKACKESNQCTTAPTNAVGADNAFLHVVGVLESGTIRFFVNGTQRGGDSGTPLYTPNAGDWFFIGHNPQDVRHFQGQIDECFFYAGSLSAAAACRICSCGISGALCACSGAAFTATGRNVSACNSCPLPAACNAATPP